jgi:hAT family C-terminal dimerisation region
LNLQNDPRETTASTNIFDDLPSLKPSDAKEPQDELERFLSTERDLNVKDGLPWWVDRKHLYPRLSRMALDYLSIPGKLFSMGSRCGHDKRGTRDDVSLVRYFFLFLFFLY